LVKFFQSNQGKLFNCIIISITRGLVGWACCAHLSFCIEET